MKKLLIIINTILISGNVFANDFYVYNDTAFQQRDGLYNQQQVLNNTIETIAHKRGFGITGDIEGLEYALRYQMYENNANQSGKVDTQKEELIIQTAYKDFEINDEISLRIGKFVETWQIGNGISPLSFIDPYSRTISTANPTNDINGAGAVLINYIADNIRYAVYAGRDTNTKNVVRGYGYKHTALKLSYDVNDNVDTAIIVHKRNTGKVGIGGSVRYLVNDASILYSSAMFRRGNIRAIHKGVLENNFVATENPVGEHLINDNKLYKNLMIGWQYTTTTNYTYWLELGYDQRGMNNKQWNQYKKMVDNHTTLSGASTPLKTPNLSWDSSIISDRGLRQKYAYARIQKDINNYKISASIKIGVDKSYQLRNELQFIGIENILIGANYQTTGGSTGTEYGEYFPYRNKISIYIRTNF